MFVPRALRLKGVKEQPWPKPSKPPPAEKFKASNDDALIDAMEGISTNSPVSQQDQTDPQVVTRGPRFTVRPITPEYLAQLVAGIELIFSDYAQHEAWRAAWLQQRYRTVEGEEKFIHLTAILEHPNISSLKPEATQVLLQRALREQPSERLEPERNGYHVRRKPSSYPPRFLPHNSFDVVNDDGLTFWDQRTIYVEPHLRNLCQTPAKVAYWLNEHGHIKPKWLPIQAVHMLWNSCAYVVLSGNVTHQDTWQKWRAAGKPDNWKILTKVEHTKRTAEYVAMLEKENPRGMRKVKLNQDTVPAIERPAIARPAALAMDVEIVPDFTKTLEKHKGKRKRNRRKGDKPAHKIDHLETDTSTNAPEAANNDDDHDDEPNSKRQA